MTGFWSSETLTKRADQEKLIKPFDPELVANCSYELRLGSEVYVTSEDSKTKRTLDHGEQVRIPPGQFANLLTEEIVQIPRDSIGLISAKFQWKQRGLVNVSGFHVDPGYEGKILFSVFNAGPTSVVVARGDRLFLLWYCDLDQATNDLYNKPPRTEISSQDVSHLQGEVATPQALAQRVEALERYPRMIKWGLGIVVAAVVSAVLGFLVKDLLTQESESISPTITNVAVPSETPSGLTFSTPSP